MAAYNKVKRELQKWHLKRVTEAQLARVYRHLREGKNFHGQLSSEKGRQSWDSFIFMTSLDVFCQLEGVPFRAQNIGDYEAQLVIDVSHDRRYFALSLLIARSDVHQPFGIFVFADPKMDFKHETINAQVLEDTIVEVIKKWMVRHAGELKSLLIIRDGKICGEEQEAIDAAVFRLTEVGKIGPQARVDTVELHKDTMKVLRLWEVLPNGSVVNVEEGMAVEISPNFCLLSCTGRSTLTQGTAEPLAITAKGRCQNLRAATDSCFASAQLNWASPSVAQRLPLPIKRGDEGLIDRAAQDIKRWS